MIGCHIKQLPKETWLQAARTAVRSNPANAPRLDVALPPLHIAALTGKLWPSAGVHLGVQFLDSPDQETRRKILAAANRWGTRSNVKFSESSSGEVRLARVQGQGYYSYLGQDILHVQGVTLNLDSFTARTPDSEYLRVVQHEFGHTLGWPHEHMRRDMVSRLDVQKTLAYFERTQGWDADTVRQQVLTPLDDATLTALPVDVLSIMCYQLPGEITRDGKPIPGGTDIDEEDFQLAAKLYPLHGAPPAPPPAPPTSSSRLFSLDFTGRPRRVGQIVSFRTPVDLAEKVDVVREGQHELMGEVLE
jgi:hypothetical protein